MAKSRKEKGHYGHAYRRIRAEVFASESHCFLCHRFVNQGLHWMHPGAPQLHLVVPWSKGGRYQRENCRLTHRYCNRKQSDSWHGTVRHDLEQVVENTWIVGEDP